MVAGIILAAGRSMRMGRCKATLPAGKTHLIGIVLDALAEAGISPLVVVTGRHQVEIEKAVSSWKIQVLFNPDWPEGQITSLGCGLTLIGSGKPVIVSLVDHPGFSSKLIQQMIEVSEKEGIAGVIPLYQGQTGHPVLYNPEMVEQLRRVGSDQTARDVVEQFKERIYYLETDEEAVIRDIDTEDEYQEFLEVWERSEK